jgi:hypothetical protein
MQWFQLCARKLQSAYGFSSLQPGEPLIRPSTPNTASSRLFPQFAMALGPIGLLRVSACLSFFLRSCSFTFNPINNFVTVVVLIHGIYLFQYRLSRGKPAEHLDILILRFLRAYFLIKPIVDLILLPFVMLRLLAKTEPRPKDEKVKWGLAIFGLFLLVARLLLPVVESMVLRKTLKHIASEHEESEEDAISLPSPGLRSVEQQALPIQPFEVYRVRVTMKPPRILRDLHQVSYPLSQNTSCFSQHARRPPQDKNLSVIISYCMEGIMCDN